jgi:TPP-dependent pyruvate/acetoin dehydrogenase alpha subunit
LVKEGGMTAAQDRAIRQAARRTVRDAVAYAKGSPYPDAEDLEKGVYA